MANEIDKLAAIKSLTPNAWFQLTDDVVSWHAEESQTEPTQAEIDAEIIRLQAVYDSQLYARTRKAKYNALNQFELMTDDAANGTTTHADAINAIKAAHPKP
jgi:hypothetical protein|tara:strand:- start:1061 stop:1366 length:306 start_codon:yes stop_codon:yes gene_type:complete